MNKLLVRLVGEWKALVWLGRSIIADCWEFFKSEVRCWWLSRPCVQCKVCGGWHAHYLIANGFCGPCSPEEDVVDPDDLVSDEVDGVAAEAWAEGHAQGWNDCLAEINRQEIGKQTTLPFGEDGDVPF